jgi:hypothetical protein
MEVLTRGLGNPQKFINWLLSPLHHISAPEEMKICAYQSKCHRLATQNENTLQEAYYEMNCCQMLGKSVMHLVNK